MWNKLPRTTTSSWKKLESVKNYLSWLEASIPWNEASFTWLNSYILEKPTTDWNLLGRKDKYVADLEYNSVFDLSGMQVVGVSGLVVNKLISKWTKNI